MQKIKQQACFDNTTYIKLVKYMQEKGQHNTSKMINYCVGKFFEQQTLIEALKRQIEVLKQKDDLGDTEADHTGYKW